MNTSIFAKTLPLCGLALFLTTFIPALSQRSTRPEVTSALKRIDDEAAKVRNDIDAQTTRLRYLRSSADNEAARIIKEGSQHVNEMRRAYTSVKGEKIPTFTSEQIQAAEDEYNERARQASAAGTRSATAAELDYNARQRSLAESARNLQDQLMEKPSTADSIILQPRGTNLYVRNYLIVGEQMEKLPHVEPAHALPYKGVYVAPNRAAQGVAPVYTPRTTVATPGSGWGNQVPSNVRTKVTGSLLKE
jgi:hypothetical protein